MDQTTTDLADADPLVFVERPDDPRTDPLRVEFTAHPAPDAAGGGNDLPHERWVADLSDEHVNPRWDERFEVVSGEWRVEFGGTERTLSEGEDATIPADVPHRHWNPAERPARIQFEVTPGLRGGEAFETIYALAQAGRVRENGLPTPLQFAVIQDAYPGYFFSTDLPRSVQRAAFKLLAPVGRRLGYEGSHSRDEIEDLR